MAIQFRVVDDVTEAYLYGAIGDVFDGYSDRDAVELLRNAREDLPINLRINSEGGLVFPGFAMYTLFRSDARVQTVTIDGIAASIASVVAQSADRVIAAPESSVMIHNPYSFVVGDHVELRKVADELAATRQQIGAVYARASGTPREDFLNLMDAESWLPADDALEAGLVTEIAGEPAQMAAYVMDHFRNAPDWIRKHGKPAPPRLRATIQDQRRRVRARDIEIRGHDLDEHDQLTAAGRFPRLPDSGQGSGRPLK